MTLDEKTGVILKQHKEGEGFFNALDFMIKGDRGILEDFLPFFMNDAGRNLELPDTGLIVGGGFVVSLSIRMAYERSVMNYGRTTRNLLCPG